MENKTVSETYFLYLYNMVVTKDYPNCRDESYYILLHKLHDIEFYWSVEHDDNRAEDGKMLRVNFADNYKFNSYEEISGCCTFLEFLIGISIRMSDEVYNGGGIDRIDMFFWELLSNLCDKKWDKSGKSGTDDWSDTKILPETLDKIVEKCHIFMDRSDKKVSIFGYNPTFKKKWDKSGTEIWDKMQEYLLKKVGKVGQNWPNFDGF